jgi:hypothetical protein
MVQRVVFPVAAVLAGIAAIVYGTMCHRAPVAQQEMEEQEQEEEVSETIQVPVPGAPGGFITQSVKAWQPVKRQVEVTKIQQVPEPAIIREITVGGIAWGPAGLRRTYSLDEPPPSLCPT